MMAMVARGGQRERQGKVTVNLQIARAVQPHGFEQLVGQAGEKGSAQHHSQHLSARQIGQD
jgi:hypothetical protein